MKLISYSDTVGGVGIGVIIDDLSFVDLTQAGISSCMIDVIERYDVLKAKIATVVAERRFIRALSEAVGAYDELPALGQHQGVSSGMAVPRPDPRCIEQMTSRPVVRHKLAENWSFASPRPRLQVLPRNVAAGAYFACIRKKAPLHCSRANTQPLPSHHSASSCLRPKGA